MTTTDREIEQIIARAEPGVNELLRSYEKVEGQYARAVSATAVRTTVVASANTLRR